MYLKLKDGKTFVNPNNGVLITHGSPIECDPILVINNQQNIQSATGYATRFYLLIYWNFEMLNTDKQPFYVQEITASEESVNQFGTIPIPEGMTEVNIPNLILLQLYTYVLSIPLKEIDPETGLLTDVIDENGDVVCQFKDWDLAQQ
jgi:hypothetical protein